MSTQWLAALDAFADHLADQRAALEHGLTPRIRPFRPPAAREPLSRAVWHFAETLLEEADELERAWDEVRFAAAATRVPRHERSYRKPLAAAS